MPVGDSIDLIYLEQETNPALFLSNRMKLILAGDIYLKRFTGKGG
jgi:hypothetical protein